MLVLCVFEKDMVGVWGLDGSVDIKGMCPDGPLAVSKNEPALGGAASPIREATHARASGIQKVETIVNTIGLMTNR